MNTHELTKAIVACLDYHGFPPVPVNGNYPLAAVVAIEEAARSLHFELPDRSWLRLRRVRSMVGLARNFAATVCAETP